MSYNVKKKSHFKKGPEELRFGNRANSKNV